MAIARDPAARRRRRSSSILALTAVIGMAYLIVRSQSTGITTHFDDPSIILPSQREFSSSGKTSSLQRKKLSTKAESDACFAKYPWIEPALEEFFEPTRRDSANSLMTSEEALNAMANITWHNGYHPGHDMVTLKYDKSLGRYDVSIEEVWRSNQPHKPVCIAKPLKAAIETHGAALAEKFNRKQLKFAVITEDFGIIWRNSGFKLPAFALCTDDAHIDIPVPDFTYGCYPEAAYANTSYPAILDLVLHKSSMLPWTNRSNTLFHRSNWGVGPRRGLMPMLMNIMDNGTSLGVLGADLDIADTGFIVSNKHNFAWLDEQCQHKVLIHTAGFSYSAALKYKMACGALVVMFDSRYKEFYDPALVDGVHVIRLPATEEGVDEQEFIEKSAPKIKKAVTEVMDWDSDELPSIGKAAQDFATNDLSPEALSCYWYGALLRYGELYFTEETEAQKKAKEEKKSVDGGNGKSSDKDGR